MSGEPPGDVTTKSPFQQVTEQPFTFEYEDATYSHDTEEQGGMKNIPQGYSVVVTTSMIKMFEQSCEYTAQCCNYLAVTLRRMSSIYSTIFFNPLWWVTTTAIVTPTVKMLMIMKILALKT